MIRAQATATPTWLLGITTAALASWALLVGVAEIVGPVVAAVVRWIGGGL